MFFRQSLNKTSLWPSEAELEEMDRRFQEGTLIPSPPAPKLHLVLVVEGQCPNCRKKERSRTAPPRHPLPPSDW